MRNMKSRLATISPSGAPSCGIIAYQPRLPSGAFNASSEARPSHEPPSATPWPMRSEEHTSELQSLMRISYAVFCLKKKTKIHQQYKQQNTIHPHQKKMTTTT